MDSEMLNEDMNQGIDESQNADEISDQLYYKYNSPMYIPEVDWTLTLSRNDFPWAEIKFGDFTTKDCYEKYASIVKDSQTFLKKVLGMKEKYRKMMQG